MSFPESERVIYKRNPLETVICQLRYPHILKIEAELPAGFQDRIRADYPIFREQNPGQDLVLSGELLKLVEQRLASLGAVRTYEFASEDGFWSVTLNKAAVALTCGKYVRWEDFRARFGKILNAIESEYQPAFYSRIGLRYTNVIKRSALGLEQVPWSKLLQSHVAGELTTQQAQEIVQSVHQVLWRLDDQNSTQVKMQYGLTTKEGGDEPIYFIDNDFFTEQKCEAAATLARLDEFHVSAGWLFRWCITKDLHEALQPIPVEAGVPG